MTRTINIMTAARAKGVELPEKWFGATCMNCPNAYAIESGHQCAMCGHIMRDDPPLEYIGPDLEREENIHHAFTVADALGKAKFGVKVEVLYDPAANVFEASFCGHCSRYAPERHLALVAACEAALWIERGEVGVKGSKMTTWRLV